MMRLGTWTRARRPAFLLVSVLLLGFFLRLFLSRYGTYAGDFEVWRGWARGLAADGFARFYEAHWADYLPGYLYVLWVFGKLRAAFAFVPDVVFFKLPANIADAGIAALLFIMARRFIAPAQAALAAALYFFNPASLVNSTLWGQVDAVQALPLLAAALAALRSRFVLSGVFAAFACMVKPQSIVVVPILLMMSMRSLFKRGRGWRPPAAWSSLAEFFLAFVGTIVLLVFPFLSADAADIGVLGAVMDFIKKRFVFAYELYPFASLNAFNVWGMFAMWKSDQALFAGLTYQRWGTLLFGLASLAVVTVFLRKTRKTAGATADEALSFGPATLQAIALILFAFFLLVTRVHERHLLPAIVFLTPLIWQSRKHLFAYGALSLFYVLNLFYAYVKLSVLKGFSFPQPVISFTDWLGGNVWIPALAALAIFAWFFWVYISKRVRWG